MITTHGGMAEVDTYLRCGCARIGLLFVPQSTAIAAKRMTNVVLGGFIGVALVPIIPAVAGAFQPARKSS
jgi:hypothetical protein